MGRPERLAPPRPRPRRGRAPALRAPSAAAQVGSAPQRPEMQRGAALCLRLWLCLGLLERERGEPAARPRARLAARGDAVRGRAEGPHRRETGSGGTRRGREGSQGCGRRPEHSGSGQAPGMRKGRAATAAGSGTGRRAAAQRRDGARGPPRSSTRGSATLDRPRRAASSSRIPGLLAYSLP